MTKLILTPIVALVVFAGIAIMGPSVILGAPTIALEDTPEFAGPIALSLGPTKNGGIQRYGGDFSFSYTQSFEDTWKVVGIKTLQDSGSGGVVILQKRDGVFQVVLGPGTSFPSTQTVSMPSDLVQFLYKEGLIYEPV